MSVLDPPLGLAPDAPDDEDEAQAFFTSPFESDVSEEDAAFYDIAVPGHDLLSTPTIPEPAEPTATEEEITQLQLDLLKDNTAWNDLTREIFAADAGYSISYDDEGIPIGLTKLSDEEMYANMTPTEQKEHALTMGTIDAAMVDAGINPVPDASGNYHRFASDEARRSYLGTHDPDKLALEDYNRAVMEKAQLAIEGKLPISATLERELAEYETTDIEATRRRLGSLDIASSAGIEAAGRRQETGLIAREAARFGQVGQLEDIRRSISQSTQPSQYFQQPQESTIAKFAGIPQESTTGLISGLLSQYGQDRQATDIYNQQVYYSGQQAKSDKLSLIGTIAAAYFTGGASVASSKEYKKDITKRNKQEEEKSLQQIINLDTYNFRYKNEDDLTKLHTGVITEETPNEFTTERGDAIDIGNALGIIISSIKTLANELAELKQQGVKDAN